MEIKVKCLNQTNNIKIIQKGDWIDLYSAENITLQAPKITVEGKIKFDYTTLNLGVAIELPKGFEAIVAPRSSAFKNYKIISANSIGIIDNSYCGNTDYWKLPIIALSDTSICKGDRIAQFRIQLSQKSNMRQKIKWLFSSKITIKFYDLLYKENRGGFGTTGK